MKKHFEVDYDKLVKKNLSSHDKHDAMAKSIGGNFVHFGLFQRELLWQHGLKKNAVLLDVGCGAGRLANALKAEHDLHYIGADIIPALLDYAKNICQRPDWQFVKLSDFKLPFANDSIDMVTAFSVFTHLLHEESYAYLAEMRRVLKPGGKLIFTFLDFAIPEHWAVFAANVLQIQDHLNQFIDPRAIEVWCQHLQLTVVGIYPGDQPHIHLRDPITAEDGTVYRDKVALGQSICVLEKPLAATEQIYATLPEAFDSDRYLQLHPDIAASGMDPRVHFICHGQFEKRRLK